jgi:acetyl esterase
VKLHPQVVALLEVAAGFPSLSDGSVETARSRVARIRDLIGPGPDIAEVADIELATPLGRLPARRYTPDDPAPGAIVWFHGGGWVTGRPADYDAVCRTLALHTGLPLVSVAYRRAPEEPFPAAADDGFAALASVAGELEAGAPLIVGGDSAGGNLAAVATLRARDVGVPVALQVLVNPVTDCNFATPSYGEYADVGLPLGRTEMEWFWDLYVPDAAERIHPFASPLRAASLEGVAPAHIVVAEHDVLRDEALRYAERLDAAGVAVDVRRYDDVTHGFFSYVGYLDRAGEAVAEAAEAIDRTRRTTA